MSEIDLIPGEYRQFIEKMLTIKVFAVVSILLVVICSGAYFYFLTEKKSIESDISQLELKKLVVAQQSDEVARLQQTRSKLENQLTLLKDLRSGDSVENMFIAIDQVIAEGGVWFKKWKFQRAGTAVREKPQGKHAGYIIVIPGEEDNAQHMWKIDTHMSIQGQARDHSELSKFVSRLFDRAEIQDVRVLKSQLRRYTKLSIVDFDLAVVVDSHAER